MKNLSIEQRFLIWLFMLVVLVVTVLVGTSLFFYEVVILLPLNSPFGGVLPTLMGLVTSYIFFVLMMKTWKNWKNKLP